MKLHHRIQGDGEPVIIIHGLFGDGLNWGGVSRILKDHFWLILPDVRNHGRSPHNDDIRYTSMADDIIELMDDLGLQNAHVVGHSMGGKIAMTLALQHPERVGSLTVVDIAPKRYPIRHRDVFAGLLAVVEAQPQTRQDAEAILQEHIQTTDVRTFILKNLERTEQGFQWRINWQALYEHYADLADFPVQEGQFDGPTQFLVGELSDYVSKVDQPTISALFPNAKGRVVGGTGHWLHAEKPELVAEWIRRFIEQTET